MNTGWALYTRWKAKQGYPSDNAARLRLGVERATISGWKNGKSQPNEEAVKLMSRDLGEDFRGYLLEIEAERSKSETIKSLLHDAAKKFAPFAAMIIIGLAHSQNANCAQIQKYTNTEFDISSAEYTFTQIKIAVQHRRCQRLANAVLGSLTLSCAVILSFRVAAFWVSWHNAQKCKVSRISLLG